MALGSASRRRNRRAPILNRLDHRLEFLVHLFLNRPNSLPFSNHGKSDRAGHRRECDESKQIAQAELEPAAFAFWGIGIGRLVFHRRIIHDRRQPEQEILGGRTTTASCESPGQSSGMIAGSILISGRKAFSFATAAAGTDLSQNTRVLRVERFASNASASLEIGDSSPM